MLSSSVIKNVGQASHYYNQQDNYYTREQGIEQSEWWGKGAEKLSLKGNVDIPTFNQLLLGVLPSGEKLGKMVDGKIKHRPGWDLTFSAPKSVSILALIGGDTRLLEAHRKAVSVALYHIERSCAQARMQTPDGTAYQNTKNLIAALYHHDLSRAKDPQLHTHSVIMNMTERLDGIWRSLASKIGGYGEKNQGEINGFIERVRHHNRYFSKIYETELAFRVKELGYEIRIDSESGKFEIVGVSKEAIQFFSKRRQQIEEKLAEKGLSGGKAAAFATLDTRNKKEDVDRVLLKEGWLEDAKKLELDCEKIIMGSKQKKPEEAIKSIDADHHALHAITQAAKALSVFQSTFTLEDLATSASEYAIRKNLNVKSLLAAVDAQLASGDLHSLANTQGKTVLMAKATLDEEKRLFTQLDDRLLERATLNGSQLKHKLNNDQTIPREHHADLETIFGQDRIILIEGKSAREALVEPTFKIAKSAHLKIALLSPTLVGSKQLANQIKKTPQSFWEQVKALFSDTSAKQYSVMQFLSEADRGTISKEALPNILMVDHAHLLSTHQKASLFEWNKIHQTKLILFGEKSKLLSQQRSISLNQLTERGVATISMTSKQDSLIKAVEEKDMQTVLKNMTGRLVEVNHAEDRHHAMINHYTHLHEKDRKESWLVAHTKSTVNELNHLTHEALVSQEKLGKAITIDVLIPQFLPEGKGVLAASYPKGQVVRFNETYSTLHVHRGDYLRVVSHSKQSNRVVLQHDNGKKVIWQPDKIAGASQKVELFNEEKRDFAVNETMVIHRSLKSKGMIKGERWIVTAIQGKNIKLKNIEGKVALLDSRNPSHRHIDYGYTATPHAIVHEKPTVVIAELPQRAFHTDQRRFYQAVSQPKEAWIYTDHAEGLVAHLEKKTGERLTAHATVSQADELKKNMHSLYDILEKHIAEQKGGHDLSKLSRTAVDAVDFAIHHLSEREAGFTHKQLMQTAMQHAVGDVTSESLNQALLAMENTGQVLRGQKNDGTLWTTHDAVKTERDIIALCKLDKGKFEPIASDALLEKHCDPEKLKPEQIAAVKAITQSRDRVMAVQGHAGTGKTTMLATVADVLAAKNLITSEGYQLIGLAPTHPAVKELTARGIPAQTIDSFIIASKRELVNNKSPLSRDKQILVLDEASMISNRKMFEILQITHQFNYRGAIPTGDTRQLPSIEEGKSFELVQAEVNTQTLVDIRRQSDNAPLLKQAVKETIAYDFKAAFQTLKDSIIEVPMQSHDTQLSKNEVRMANRVERVRILVKDYFSFAKEERENIQVITPGHDDRKLANHLIREGLKDEGALSKDKDQSFTILTSKNLTQVERSHITNLAVGDILRFGHRESSHIKAGEYFSIVAMNANHNILTLKGEAGREVVWQVPTFDKKRLSSIEIFQKESRELQAGDMIRWSRSDKKNELLSTETARVTALEKDKITVELANKQIVTFNPGHAQFQHWDHGYAATVYAVQGKTKEIILAHLESFREFLTTQPSFLVALTRAVNTFRLYTDNIEKLLQTIERNTGVKLSSLEVIGEFPETIIKKIEKKSSQTTLSDVISSTQKKEKARENKQLFDRYAVDRIKEGLNKDAEKIAIDILGTPKERGNHYLKFGRHKGSLTVTIKGEKQGWFNDFETNKGGRDMLKFIQVYGGMEKSEALQYGVNRLGILTSNNKKKFKINVKNAYSEKEKPSYSFSDYEKKRMLLANKIASESQPLKGTLAEKYLQDYRGISLEKVPEDIRFHPSIYSGKNQKNLPALIAIARNKDGKIQSVEAIYLDAKTGNKADVPLLKQTIGPKKGAMVVINQTNQVGAPTLISEGVATGLSLAQSLPEVNVRITLGKQVFASIDPGMLSQKAIFCLDNDGKNLKTDKMILEAANRLIDHKKEVSFMVPTGLDMKKQDYNDILKQRGSEAVQHDFRHAISYDHFYRNNASSSSINLEKMAQLSYEAMKNNRHQDKVDIKAYQSIKENDKSLSTNQIPSRNINVEREI